MLIGPLGTNFSKILIEIHTFSFKKCIWICRLENGGHLVLASMCLTGPRTLWDNDWKGGTDSWNRCMEWAGPWFNIEMTSYQYMKSHCGDKTVVRSSYLHNGISYIGKMSSLYWIGPSDWLHDLQDGSPARYCWTTSSILLLFILQDHQTKGYLLNITFIFDKCHHSLGPEMWSFDDFSVISQNKPFNKQLKHRSESENMPKFWRNVGKLWHQWSF